MSDTKSTPPARPQDRRSAKKTTGQKSRPKKQAGTREASEATSPSTAPIILHLGGGREAEEATELGFTAVMLSPLGPANRPVRDVPSAEAREAVARVVQCGLPVYCDLPWYAHSASSPLVREHPDWLTPEAGGSDLDPRSPEQRGARTLLTERSDLRDAVVGWLADRARALAADGAKGVRLPDIDKADEAFWRAATDAIRAAMPDAVIIGDGLGGAFGATRGLQAAGFDYVLDSGAWWDGRADWFLDQRQALDVPTIGFPQAPEADGLATRTDMPLAQAAAHRTARALLASTGVLVPASLVEAAGSDFRAVLPDLLAARKSARWMDRKGPLAVTSDGLLRTDADPRFASHGLALSGAEGIAGALMAAGGQLDATRVASAGPSVLVTLARRSADKDALPSEHEARKRLDTLAAARVAIENPYPVIDDGRFAAKRIVGDRLVVGADVFTDGHDLAAADIVLTEAGEAPLRVPMAKGLNDRWAGEATLTRMGRSSFRIEAWRDDYASWVSEVTKKRAAGVDVSLEAIEGQRVVERSLKVAAKEPLSDDEKRLVKLTREGMKKAEGDTEGMIALLTAPPLGELLRRHGERPYVTKSAEFPLTVDRRQARFSAWYELFPRSQSGSEDRHGTFDDVIARLPYVRDLGFDVLYFPPIHPIGKTNRKGKNNSLRAEAGDVGSPYAIGSEEGGYKSVHPELGTIEDFDRLVAAAAEHGLEIALDIALNSSPDHPWIKEHPEWFEHRPDGSIKFAENPPKKYEDIVNLHYYGEAIPSLWYELRDTFLFWCEHGVKMFRVDNPHTKPYPMWEWLIEQVKAAYPDALFLSEAFTRPKVMARLAKLGYTQSYTYYTWRNTKHELEAYVRELTTTQLREFMNPNFFMNTPDINPIPLQTNNRCAHVARMVLAGTLSASWGLYNGIEIVESTVLPGKEEYLNSEKYQIRAWDMDRPGHIKDEIRLINRLRARHPAMQEHCTVQFLTAWNDQVSFYAKRTPDLSDYLLFAVTFDYERDQRATCELPLWEFGLPDDGSIAARDLVSGDDFTWQGKYQDITLGPDRPFAAFQLFGPTRKNPAPLYDDLKAER